MSVSKCTKIVLAMGISALVTAGVLPVNTYADDGAGTFIMRARLLGVVPEDSSTNITVIGGNAEVDSNLSLDLDFTYFITNNIAAELTLALTRHDVDAMNTAAGNLNLGDVYLLPPTLTMQYHFIPGGTFHPYIGAGVNYTIFFDGDSGVAADLDYDNSFGLAIQAGFDMEFDENWALNFDVKKIWLNTDVTVRALGTTVETEVDIDPWLFGIGVAYRF